MAATARWWLCSANFSMSSRVAPHLRAIISADRYCDTGTSPYRRRHPSDPENGSAKPNCWPAAMAAVIGIALMFCTPPATITSAVPLITACAAKCTACWEEPHWRSMVTPGTWSGRPAASQLVRATSPDCGPIASQQPKMTSSTAAGSMPARSIREPIALAPRSALCTPASGPPRRVTGVRTAPTSNACATAMPSLSVQEPFTATYQALDW
jgi:hypothetical protein